MIMNDQNHDHDVDHRDHHKDDHRIISETIIRLSQQIFMRKKDYIWQLESARLHAGVSRDFVASLENMSRQNYERILNRLSVPVKKRDRKYLNSVIAVCENNEFSTSRKDAWSFDKTRNKQRRVLNMTKRAVWSKASSMGLISCSEATFNALIMILIYSLFS